MPPLVKVRVTEKMAMAGTPPPIITRMPHSTRHRIHNTTHRTHNNEQSFHTEKNKTETKYAKMWVATYFGISRTGEVIITMAEGGVI